MIRVRDSNVLKRIPKGSRFVIDLEDASSKEEVLMRIVSKLSSAYSHTVDGTSLDYFVDVLSDWIRELLPTEAHVIILNCKQRIRSDDAFLAKIVACVHQAMMMALSQRFQDAKDFDFLTESRALRFDFYV